MAHPLTQHPPSALAFGSTSRPSPLAFGFGSPAHHASRSFSANSPSPFAFQGLTSSAFPSPSPNSGVHRRTAGPPPTTPSRQSAPTTSSLKRPRQTPSPTPSSSSRSPSTDASPRLEQRKLPGGRGKVDIAVGGLDLRDEPEKRARPLKQIKRQRGERIEAGVNEQDQLRDVDVGLLLGALPSTAHLPILLRLLGDNPSLRSNILSLLPHPDLTECIGELQKQHDRIRKAAGQHFDPSRAWERVGEPVTEFCRSAITYLTFFTRPPSASHSSASSPDAATLHTLLHHLTQHLLYILSLIPSSASSDAPASAQLMSLANLVLSSWTTWIAALSDEVNRRGGMYPLSTVSAWAESLEALCRDLPQDHGHQQQQQASAPTSISWSTPTPPAPNTISHPIVTSFRSALQPIRTSFFTELGWLLGPRQSVSVPRPPILGFGAINLFGSRTALAAGGGSGDDEEL